MAAPAPLWREVRGEPRGPGRATPAGPRPVGLGPPPRPSGGKPPEVASELRQLSGLAAANELAKQQGPQSGQPRQAAWRAAPR